MNDETKNLLESVRRGEVSVDEAYLKLRTAPFRDLGFAKIDTHRRLRTGAAEVIYGAGKTPEQMLEIIKAMLESGQKTILITRLEKHAAEILSREFALSYCEIAKIGSIGSIPEPSGNGCVVVAAGGTSDIPVAEEAALTAEFHGSRVLRLYDVGVAGLHRLLSHIDEIMGASVIIAVAGMEGALASVIGVNYAFTFPYMKLNFSIYGYPVTFVTMLAVSLVISTLTTRAREQEKLRHEAAQAKLRADLLRAISHDLRTPLTSIIGSIDTVLNEGDHLSSDERNVLLSDAKQDAEWLVRMVENLLSITRISGTEQTHIEKSPELVEEILGECLANFKKRNPETNLKVTIPDEPVLVNVDAMLIAQVIMNLLDNAAKHASGMTELRLDVTLDGKWVHFTVSDNGSGIDPKILPVLFRGQIDPEKGKPYDSNRFRGIGLAACQAIVSAHGGKRSASNRPEGGAVFDFSLPAEEEEE